MKTNKTKKSPVQAEALRCWLPAVGAASLRGGHSSKEAMLSGRQLILHGEIWLPDMLLPTEDNFLKCF